MNNTAWVLRVFEYYEHSARQIRETSLVFPSYNKAVDYAITGILERKLSDGVIIEYVNDNITRVLDKTDPHSLVAEVVTTIMM